MGGNIDTAALKKQAWWNVAVGLVTWALIIVMPSTLMPVLFGPVMDDMGWSRGQAAAFSSFKFGTGAALALFLGHIIDRLGLTRVMVTGMVFTGLALAALYFAHSLWVYYSLAALLGAASLCCVAGTNVLIARWFSARLGFALGVALTGGSFIGLVVPVTAAALSGLYGWRVVTMVMGAVILVVLVPFYLWKVDETPARHGTSAEAIDPPAAIAAPIAVDAAAIAAEPAFAQLLRARAFWVVLFTQVVIGAADHAMDDHLTLFLSRDVALGPMIGASGFSLSLVAGAAGKLGFGWFFDRYSLRGISLSWALLAVGIALAFPVAGLGTFLLFTLVRGTTHAGALVEIPICAKHAFGTRSLSKTIATFVAANALGGAIGTGGVGFMHDAYGSYVPAFLVMIAGALVASVMLLAVKPAYWSRAGQRQQTKPLAVPVPASER